MSTQEEDALPLLDKILSHTAYPRPSLTNEPVFEDRRVKTFMDSFDSMVIFTCCKLICEGLFIPQCGAVAVHRVVELE